MRKYVKKCVVLIGGSALLATSLATSLLANAAIVPKMPTPPKDYPAGKLGEYVKLGEAIIMNTNTHALSKDFVGNALKCTDCHIDGGRTNRLGTFIGTATSFPAWSKREGTLQSLEDRINNCFMRSMNGKRPINGTKLSMAMAAYVSWLSTNIPMKMNAKKPVTPYYTPLWPNKEATPLIKKATHANYLAGEKLYKERCMVCHMENGQGVKGSFPPLWGKDSYNAGAGLSKLNKLASWLMYNMPKGAEGSLSLQEAVDLAIFVDAHPRPSFNLAKHLQKGVFYNSNVHEEKSSVKSNFKAFGLDVRKIAGK